MNPAADAPAGNRLLIAGIGNVFLGDDAFGVELVARLRRRTWPAGVRIEDFGIRGIDLTYALLDERLDAAILLDAVSRGGEPGTLYRIEPEVAPVDAGAQQGVASVVATAPLLAAHDLDPATVLRLVRSMGGTCRRVTLVGCEPHSLGTEDGGDGRWGTERSGRTGAGRRRRVGRGKPSPACIRGDTAAPPG